MFEQAFAQFESCVDRLGLGKVIPNQWELTYVDDFPRGEYWETPADWSGILPGLFGSLFSAHDLDMELEHRAAEWCYELRPQKGRLHITARPGRWGDSEDALLLLQMTARGPIGKGGVSSLRQTRILSANGSDGISEPRHTMRIFPGDRSSRSKRGGAAPAKPPAQTADRVIDIHDQRLATDRPSGPRTAQWQSPPSPGVEYASRRVPPAERAEKTFQSARISLASGASAPGHTSGR